MKNKMKQKDTYDHYNGYDKQIAADEKAPFLIKILMVCGFAFMAVILWITVVIDEITGYKQGKK